MKTSIYLSMILVSFLFGGCAKKCCDCDNEMVTGEGDVNLRLIRDWTGLWSGITKPERVDVYFYNSLYPQPQIICTYTDTTCLAVSNGSYNILAISDRMNVVGLESYQTAKVSLPVRLLDGKYITSEPSSSTVADYTSVFIDGDKENECIVTPSLIVYVINFRIKIRTDFTDEIVSCTAELQGVETSRMLSGGGDPTDVHATLQMMTVKKDRNVFDRKVSILGLSGKGNYLDIAIECEDGTLKSALVDLTNLFDFSLSPVQNCLIDLFVSADQVAAEVENVRVENWEQGDEGNIELFITNQ